MTVNGAIVAANVVIALALLALGLVLVWRAWGRLRHWPVSAYVALSGPYILPGIVIGQLALFRATDLAPPFTPNGWGTLGLRVLCAVVTLSLVGRVWRGQILTDADRRRLDGGG